MIRHEVDSPGNTVATDAILATGAQIPDHVQAVLQRLIPPTTRRANLADYEFAKRRLSEACRSADELALALRTFVKEARL